VLRVTSWRCELEDQSLKSFTRNSYPKPATGLCAFATKGPNMLWIETGPLRATSYALRFFNEEEPMNIVVLAKQSRTRKPL